MIPTYESLKVHELTPVEEYNGILFKRDDMYTPFDDIPLNGGKVRQCACLFLNNYSKIVNEYDSTVVTATSVNSPQGINMSRVAQEFGFSSVIVFGAAKKHTLEKNPLVQWMKAFDSEIDYQCRIGYESALTKRIQELQQTRKMFHVKFGFNLESDPSSIVESVGHQVQNLQDHEIDNLVIPTGSAITAGGVLWGLQKYNIKVKKNVYIVQIAGYDRNETLYRIFKVLDINNDNKPKYEFIVDKSYPYSKHLSVSFNERGEVLDPVYESKAFVWMMNNLDVIEDRTLFWIIGNSNFFRVFAPY